MLKKVFNPGTFELSLDKNFIEFGETFTVTLQGYGPDVYPGMKIPYRVLNSPSPYGSNILLIDFTYDDVLEYNYLNVILSEPLGNNEVSVTQIGGPTVVLEKINDILYRYKKPLDIVEKTRTFRATLITNFTSGDMTPGVRAFDFSYSQEISNFVLDNNLKATKTFKNNISKDNQKDRVFNLSLYYNPSVYTSTLFLANHQPEYTGMETLPIVKPTLTIKPELTSIYKGQNPTFILEHTGIRAGYVVKFSYRDSLEGTEHRSSVVISNTNRTYIVLDNNLTIQEEDVVSFVTVTLLDFKLTSKIYILPITEDLNNRAKQYITSSNSSFSLKPNESAIVELIGAGGSGGNVVKAKDKIVLANHGGSKGESSTLKLPNGVTYIATGGEGGGASGYTTILNGLLFNGVFGTSGKESENITPINPQIFVLETIKGRLGLSSKTTSIGGEALRTIDGYVNNNGEGGEGADSLGWGDSKGIKGGPGVSGGYLKLRLTNNTKEEQSYQVSAGKGVPTKQISNSTVKIGKPGKDGIVVVTREY